MMRRPKTLAPILLLLALLLGGLTGPSPVAGEENLCERCCDTCDFWADYYGQQCSVGYWEPIECSAEAGPGENHCEVICYYDPLYCTIEMINAGCTEVEQ